ncbi:MAG: DMT family transporter [Castellaniella sp.]|uniref:DMT family transporter n=1 Tax=Castellaniella sp. TaxID=1955812 RepID=UPI0012136015|nr:DMT family transporter [Castellaniella sp.]TAN27829.1 MAG: DMT family transporter [Castellaniella sp.]
MNNRLTAGTVVLLLIPPLMWAGNAVIGRAVASLVSPLTLNFLRWMVALLLLLPLGWRVLRPDSVIWREWRRYALLGLLGVGLYNSLQYLALHTSTAVNVTLVAASMPIWMLLVGRVFYGAGINAMQIVGAVLSLVGVVVVLSQGRWVQLLALHFVFGDLLMVVATILWAFYSWQLTRISAEAASSMPWADFLLAQIVYGVGWSGLLSALEWGVGEPVIVWDWPIALAILFVAVGPAVLAYRCWGVGVRRVGPTVAGFFFNLTPLFAALLSQGLLNESPHEYHVLAFALILGGIVLASRPGRV